MNERKSKELLVPGVLDGFGAATVFALLATMYGAQVPSRIDSYASKESKK
jgi:hypothetical protein